MSAGKNTFGHDLVKSWGWLDPLANLFGAIVTGVYKIPGARLIKDLLHGTWPLHHPFHPAITDLTIGGYTAMVAVDALYVVTGEPGLLRAADFVLIVAFITSLGSIVSGLTDWNDTVDDERRTGMLHGLLMLSASVLFVISLVMRVNGGIDVRSTAIALSTIGWLVLLTSSYLGGEMVFGFGTQINRQAWNDVRGGWQTLELSAAALEDRKPQVGKTKQGVDLFVTKLDGAIYAMANTCTHAGGPLNEGTWVGSDRCEIQCPFHASRFCVKDGSVHRGPASFKEPVWETRVNEAGRIEVRAKD